MIWLLIHAGVLLAISTLSGFAVGWLLRGPAPRSFRPRNVAIPGLGAYEPAVLPPRRAGPPTSQISTGLPADHALSRPRPYVSPPQVGPAQVGPAQVEPEQPVAAGSEPGGAASAAVLSDLSSDEIEGLVRTAKPAQPPLLEAPEGEADDLKVLTGIGPANEVELNRLGVYHLRQIASWDAGQVAWVAAHIPFSGRIIRENWMAQAARLLSGGGSGSAEEAPAEEASPSLRPENA